MAGSVFGAGREAAGAGGTCGVRTPSGAGRRRGEARAAAGTASCPDVPLDFSSQGRFYVVQTLPFSSIILCLRTARIKLVGEIVQTSFEEVSIPELEPPHPARESVTIKNVIQT